MVLPVNALHLTRAANVGNRMNLDVMLDDKRRLGGNFCSQLKIESPAGHSSLVLTEIEAR